MVWWTNRHIHIKAHPYSNYVCLEQLIIFMHFAFILMILNQTDFAFRKRTIWMWISHHYTISYINTITYFTAVKFYIYQKWLFVSVFSLSFNCKCIAVWLREEVRVDHKNGIICMKIHTFLLNMFMALFFWMRSSFT